MQRCCAPQRARLLRFISSTVSLLSRFALLPPRSSSLASLRSSFSRVTAPFALCTGLETQRVEREPLPLLSLSAQASPFHLRFTSKLLFFQPTHHPLFFIFFSRSLRPVHGRVRCFFTFDSSHDLRVFRSTPVERMCANNPVLRCTCAKKPLPAANDPFATCPAAFTSCTAHFSDTVFC